MSETPNDAQSEPREPEDDGKNTGARAGDDPAPGASENAEVNGTASAAGADAAERTPERPPPYPGTYGAPPGQAPPAPAAPPAPVAGYGRPGAPGRPYPGYPPQPGYPPPGYQQPGYGPPGAPYPGAPRPGAAGPQDMPAGRWARLGAGLLDSLVLGFVSTPVSLVSLRRDRIQEAAESGEPIINPLEYYDLPRLMAGYAIIYLVGFVYFTYMHARWGQTLGKKALGIRVVRAADHSAISRSQAVGRQGFVLAISLAALVADLIFLPAGAVIGLLVTLDNAWILWDPRRQALHDKAAGTLVVKAAPWIPDPYARS